MRSLLFEVRGDNVVLSTSRAGCLRIQSWACVNKLQKTGPLPPSDITSNRAMEWNDFRMEEGSIWTGRGSFKSSCRADVSEQNSVRAG
ncbi:hypothetical protein SKAU_G00024980 [Synaphobranchus kaupii]|uniref:Uncharacterized protein n=1 Tax=Synaphobranchus kaupii TaxID=118154 RepID=A0A9Q1JEA9_SYNKA|nr:hypothetical protein SKAU_G00024980 [Synaphobranchus kaupii]